MSDQALESPIPQSTSYHSQARQAELSAWTKIFPGACLAVVLITGLPALLVSPDSSSYSHTLAVCQGATAGIAALFGIIGLYFLPTHPNYKARPQLILSALLIALLAVNHALALLETDDIRHAYSPIVAMICAALLYPRLIGVLVMCLPQLALLTWMAYRSNWDTDWNFGLVFTYAGTLTAFLTFYLRQTYYRRHHALLAERNSYIEALRHESAERALLQEQVLTERHLTTLGRLAGGVAHDLNNILMPVMGHAAMLEESVQTSTHKHQAREILNSARRARNLTQQLDYFSARNSNKFETLNLNQLLADLCPIVWRTFPQGIDIDLNAMDKTIYLRANRVVLQDLITNLLLDAGNAATPQNAVTIKVVPNAVPPDHFTPPPMREFCAVVIGDGAEPMTDEQRNSLFELDNIGQRGIGLLGARDTAEALGGHLGFNAAADGSNQFCLFLPVQETQNDQTSRQDSEVSAAVAPEVLVVDDEPSVRRVTSQLLNRMGFVVRECANGESALEEINTHLPDAIIMDLRMPGMGGRAATENIREQHPNLPIIICTGFTGDAGGWLSNLPNSALLQKPYDAKDLINAVNSLLNAEFAEG